MVVDLYWELFRIIYSGGFIIIPTAYYHLPKIQRWIRVLSSISLYWVSVLIGFMMYLVIVDQLDSFEMSIIITLFLLTSFVILISKVLTINPVKGLFLIIGVMLLMYFIAYGKYILEGVQSLAISIPSTLIHSLILFGIFFVGSHITQGNEKYPGYTQVELLENTIEQSDVIYHTILWIIGFLSINIIYSFSYYLPVNEV